MAFLAAFTIEILIYFAALGALNVFSDGWLVFDLVILTSNWSALLMFSSAMLNSLPILRALRILRVLRLVGKINPMRCVATAFLNLMSRMGAIIGL
eukprot:6869494-Ditylum_brightwellii.AAC.1